MDWFVIEKQLAIRLSLLEQITMCVWVHKRHRYSQSSWKWWKFSTMAADAIMTNQSPLWRCTIDRQSHLILFIDVENTWHLLAGSSRCRESKSNISLCCRMDLQLIRWHRKRSGQSVAMAGHLFPDSSSPIPTFPSPRQFWFAENINKNNIWYFAW